MEVKAPQTMRVALAKDNDRLLREIAARQGRTPTNLANHLLREALNEKPA